MNITIDENKVRVLSIDIIDVEEWAQNFIDNRVSKILSNNGISSIEEAVDRLESKEILSRSEKFDVDTEEQISSDRESNMRSLIDHHALTLKIGAVNTHLPPETQFPVSRDGMTTIKERYDGVISAINTANTLGIPVSDEEKQQAGLILQVYQFHNAVDAAAQTIIAAGDAADPVASDKRWP